MIETSETIGALTKAFVQAQGEMEAVAKDSKNPHFKSRYASLENVVTTARPVLHKHGLAFSQAPGSIEAGVLRITTRLMHESGEWMQSTLEIPPMKIDPQGIGSAITYGCRYALMAVLGLPPTDDDGESSMNRTMQRAPSKFGHVLERAAVETEFGRQVKASLATEAPKQSAYAARKEGYWPELEADLYACQTRLEVVQFANSKAVRDKVVKWPTEWRAQWQAMCEKHKIDCDSANDMVPDHDDLTGLEGAMP